MKKQLLSQLDGMLLELTKTRGVLRKLHPEDPILRAQAAHFVCPLCRGSKYEHGVTILFDLASVPKDLKPEGRFTPNHQDVSRLTIYETIYSPTACGWSGEIRDGEVLWE